ncbi:hypothetical protein MUK60_07320 [Streptomyces sp. LRE541]|uniref:hypothetical protein n=1 Tax=Streptomyces sp. LRE541 TaxID=2931983 RepID=UPI00200D6BDD|nr:hypothetical protein [Streptomyces sp. LRE541]UPZ27642.1 hypothetical protein MUK60_07320 [Streptomyces sp. LRE541]
MASPDLPLWVWNLIIAVQGHEDQHASSDPCLKGVLNAVPAEVRSQAEAISAYVQQARGDEVADKAAKMWGDLMAGLFPKPGNESEAAS